MELTLEQKYKIALAEVEFYKLLVQDHVNKLKKMGYKFSEEDDDKKHPKLSINQKSKTRDWVKTLPKSKLSIEKRVEYKMKKTGIGTYITATDTVSGEKLDISDYDNW